MACEITILDVRGVLGDEGELVSVKVTGTAQDCTSLIVTLGCSGESVEGRLDDPEPIWSFTFDDPGCICGEIVIVKAVCADNPNCRADWDGDLELECWPACWTLDNITVSIARECDEDRTHRTVTFTFPAPTTGELSFGDGTADTTFFLSMGCPHPYVPPGPYEATLRIEGCPDIPIPVGPLEVCPATPPEEEKPPPPEEEKPPPPEEEKPPPPGEEKPPPPGEEKPPPPGEEKPPEEEKPGDGCGFNLCSFLLGLVLSSMLAAGVLAVLAGCGATPLILFAVVTAAAGLLFLGVWGALCASRAWCRELNTLIDIFIILSIGGLIASALLFLLGNPCWTGTFAAWGYYGTVLAILVRIAQEVGCLTRHYD